MPQDGTPPDVQGLAGRATVAVVDAARRAAWAVVVVLAALVVALGAFVAGHLGFNTDTSDMLSPDLPFRQANAAYRKVFPDFRNPVLIVIDGTNADRVADGAAALAARLGQETKLIRSVLYPPSDPFFRQNGLLYLSTDALADLSDRIAQNQAFLATLARDPSLRGLFGLLTRALTEGAGELEKQAGMQRGLDAITAVVAAQAKGEDATLSWTTLMGSGVEAMPNRREILVETVADQSSLSPEAGAIAFIHATLIDLGLTEAQGFHVRLTGEAALKSDELASVFSGAALASVLSFTLVAVLVMVGLRSVRLVAAVILTLLAGLVFTSAFASAVVGTLNLISVAFAVLFIGIAVDFGIHFSLRYKEARLGAMAHDAALRHAASRVGPSLLLAGVAALIAFFSFLPTSYRGLAELGLISGAGMVFAVTMSLTLLPALLTILPKGTPRGPAVAPRAAALEAFVRRHARTIAIVAGIVLAASIWLAAGTRFETNPLNLQDPSMPSVATLRELMHEDAAHRPSISIVAPDLEAAVADAARLKALPSVAEVVTAADLVPKDQNAKLRIVEDMGLFLSPLVNRAGHLPAPDAQERRAAIAAFLDAAKEFLMRRSNSPVRPAIRDLSAALDGFMAGPGRTEAGLARLEAALTGGLEPRLDDLVETLKAKPVTLADVPENVRRRYIAPDGRARVEVRPKKDLTDDAALRRFVREVTSVFPGAVGEPIQLYHAADAVVSSFVTASTLALVLIALLLVAVLRSVWDAAYVLAPLVVAGTLTFALSSLVGLDINFANIIVLPLLLGLGVSSGIYLVTRAREEPGRMLLQTITPRAVVFSALTTIASFGSLAVSGHHGMASMGELLLIAISLSLACTMVVLPALLVLRYRSAGVARNAERSR